MLLNFNVSIVLFLSTINFSLGQENFNNFKFTALIKKQNIHANEQLDFFEKKIKGDSILRIEYTDYLKSRILSVMLNVKGTAFHFTISKDQ